MTKSPGGWFASVDRDATGDYVWQPCLDLGDTGHIPTFEVWFKSREECEAFIRDEVIPNAGALIPD